MADSMDLKLAGLLQEAQIPPSASAAATEFVEAVAAAVRSIPEADVSGNVAAEFVKGVRAEESKLGFRFIPPEIVRVVGSFGFGGAARPDVGADLLVRMPKKCFYEKDYLNHRYHAKRLLYLHFIAKSLAASHIVGKVGWSTFRNEARKPVLLIYPAVDVKGLPEFYVRIIPTATLLFDASKLKLSKNNIRGLCSDGAREATPKYNSSILEDMFLEANADYVQRVFADWKNLREALVLLKLWARHRSSIYTHDCLDGFLMSILMAYRTTEAGGTIIDKSMTMRQIFRSSLKFIANPNTWKNGIYLQPVKQCALSKEDLADYKDNFPFILCDITCHYNMAFRFSEAAIQDIQDTAISTLKCLDKSTDSAFNGTFNTTVDFAAKFDSCLRINLKGNTRFSSLGFCLDDESWRIYEKEVQSLLVYGLSTRAKMIRVIWRNTPSEWNIDEGFSKFGCEPMMVGVMISSPEKSYRLVDTCNHEKKEEVIKFRKFWGEKSELRRFKDGAIVESTVWDCESWERHTIVKRITEYVLSKHLMLPKEDFVHTVDQLDFCLQLGGKDPVSFSGAPTEAFEKLSKELRNLENIPLRISTVQPLDPAFRHTSVYPPAPHPLAIGKKYFQKLTKFVASCIPSMEVMIQLEGSGNWPMDSIAIEKTKSAFLLKIGECLQEQSGIFCIASEDEVDVIISGYSFRLRIFHERGVNMVKSQSGIENKFSVDRELFFRSQHSSMINGLHGRFPLYGPVARLAKRWVCAHLFSSVIAEEAVELVVAHLFLQPFPFDAPCSRIAGFLRFLRLVSNYDWTSSPLILDINGDFTLKDEQDVMEHFGLIRKSHKQSPQFLMPAMYISTSYDKFSEAWTRNMPSKLLLKRLASYAKCSADLLTNLIIHGDNGPFQWECLFKTPLNNYDAVVLLHQNKLSQPQHVLFPTESLGGELIAWGKPTEYFHAFVPLGGHGKSFEDSRKKLLVNFDPTKYFLRDIKSAFPDTFMLWYDALGGDAIGLTWDRNTKKRSRDEADESSGEPSAVLKEVGELGKGLVKGVYLLKSPRLAA